MGERLVESPHFWAPETLQPQPESSQITVEEYQKRQEMNRMEDDRKRPRVRGMELCQPSQRLEPG